MRDSLTIDLILDVLDLEREVSCGVFDPLEARVEVLERRLHVSNLLLFLFVAAQDINVCSMGMALFRLLHLPVDLLKAFVKLTNVVLQVKRLGKHLLSA